MSTAKFGFTVEELIERGRVAQADVDEIKAWLSTENLPKLIVSEEQIALFLISCQNQHQLTKATIKSFNVVRNGSPALFTGRNLNGEDVQQQLKAVEFCVFPKRTKDGCAIMFHRLYDTVYSNYNMEPAMKLLFMTLDTVVYDNPPTGLIILFDMKGVGLMHLTKVRLGLVKTFFHYLQESLPVKLRNVHVLNTVYFIDKVISIIKPFIKKEVMELLHFHPTDMDMETFYDQVLPRKCLPEELGGYLPSVRTLHEQNIQKLSDMISHFEAEELQRRIQS